MQEQDSTHTAGPWSFAAKLSASENHKGFGVWGASGPGIAEVYPLDEDGIRGEANAAFIVRAVNNHEALLAALDFAVALYDARARKPGGWEPLSPADKQWAEASRKLIAKARNVEETA